MMVGAEEQYASYTMCIHELRTFLCADLERRLEYGAGSEQPTSKSACLLMCWTVSTEALQVLIGDMPWDLQVRRVTIAHKVKTGLAMQPEESRH